MIRFALVRLDRVMTNELQTIIDLIRYGASTSSFSDSVRRALP